MVTAALGIWRGRVGFLSSRTARLAPRVAPLVEGALAALGKKRYVGVQLGLHLDNLPDGCSVALRVGGWRAGRNQPPHGGADMQEEVDDPEAVLDPDVQA